MDKTQMFAPSGKDQQDSIIGVRPELQNLFKFPPGKI